VSSAKARREKVARFVALPDVNHRDAEGAEAAPPAAEAGAASVLRAILRLNFPSALLAISVLIPEVVH